MPFKQRSNEDCKIILSKVLYFGMFCAIFVVEGGLGALLVTYRKRLIPASAGFLFMAQILSNLPR